MVKPSLQTVAYGVVWFAVAWLCLQAGQGESSDHLVVALGLSLLHAAYAALLARSRSVWRIALLSTYILLSGLLLSILLLHRRFIQSGGVLGADALRAAAQSNLFEAIAYLNRLITPADVLAGLAFAAVLAVIFPRNTSPTRLREQVLLGLAVTVGAFATYRGSIPILEPIRHHIAQYRAEMGAFRKLLSQRKSMPAISASSEFEGTVVVVVGESTSRRHMSSYGYFRQTMPRIDSRGDAVTVFTDVISPHSHTVPALAAAFTSSGSTQEQEFFSERSIDIVSLARSAGFETHWLSNQNEFGVWDNPITAIAKESHHTRFLSSSIGMSFRRSSRDHELPAQLRSTLDGSQAKRKLVILHLFSNHWPYCANFPQEFRHFEGRLGAKFFGKAREPGDVNCYDNGIRYIDSVLDDTIKVLSQESQPAVLLYFSDHGEAPLLATGHDSFRHSSYHIEIPLLLWGNDTYAKAHPAKLAVARSNRDRPYSTAQLFHSLSHLAGIEYSGFDASRSLFSERLVDRPRSAMNETIQYDQWLASNDYRENAAVNLRRLGERKNAVWAHRINSLGALAEALPIFDGIEMDLVYVDNRECFHVYHPPPTHRYRLQKCLPPHPATRT